MTIALWIIAICELIRALQNMIQITMMKRDAGAAGLYAQRTNRGRR